MNAGVGAFILTARGLTGAEMGQALSAALPRMRNVANKRTRPFVATVTATGSIAIVLGGARRGGIKRPGR